MFYIKIINHQLKKILVLNLVSLRITAAASAIDAGNQIKIHGSGTTNYIISDEEMNDIMKIVQALKILLFY